MGLQKVNPVNPRSLAATEGIPYTLITQI